MNPMPKNNAQEFFKILFIKSVYYLRSNIKSSLKCDDLKFFLVLRMNELQW